MSRFSAQNSAQNITIADATAFLSKLRKLGFTVGELHVNESTAGADQANYVTVDEALAAGMDVQERVCAIVWARRDWRNVAMLKLMFGGGSLAEFNQVADQLSDSSNVVSALNIPGAAAAVERLIAKA